MNAHESAALEIPHEIDRRPIIWSYSLLHNFRDICPHQGEARYITKTTKFIPTPESQFGDYVHEALALRVGGKPLPTDINKWEKFAAHFDNKGAKAEEWFQVGPDGRECKKWAPEKVGHGKLDLHIIKGDIGYLGDWKSGGNSKYEDEFELAVQAVLLKGRYPHLTKIIGQYIWLKDGRLSKPYDVSNTQATWNEIQSIMATVTNYRKIAEFPKRPSGLCGWCQRYDCSENPKGQG